MTKKDLAKKIADEVGVNQVQALQIVQKTFEGIISALVDEGRIELRNFGVFEVKRRKSREARNPKTGEKVMVAERFVVTFKPGREMEQRIGELKHDPNKRLARAESRQAGAVAGEPEPQPSQLDM